MIFPGSHSLTFEVKRFLSAAVRILGEKMYRKCVSFTEHLLHNVGRRTL